MIFFTRFNAALFLIIVSISIIITCILIFSKPQHKQRAFYLTIFLQCLSVFGLAKYSLLTGHGASLYFSSLSLVLLHAAAASIYLYFSTFLTDKNTVPARIFFAPFLLISIVALIVLVSKNLFLVAHLSTILIASLCISLPLYLYYTIGLYRQRNGVPKSLLYLFIAICIAFLSFFIAGLLQVRKEDARALECFGLLMIIVIYWLAFFGYLRMKTVVAVTRKKEQQYFKSLEEQEVKHCLELVHHAFEIDKVFLNPELSLPALASLLQVSPRLISAVLNQQLNKGFNEFLNEYRIAEACRLLKDPQKSHLTIAAIGYDSGFNSLATFQRTFKKITGTTPKEFLAN